MQGGSPKAGQMCLGFVTGNGGDRHRHPGAVGELGQPLCPGVSPCVSWLCWHCSVLLPEVMLPLAQPDSPAQHLPALTLCVTAGKQPQHPRCLRAARDFYPLSQDIPHRDLSLCSLCLCSDRTKHLYFRILYMFISYLL